MKGQHSMGACAVGLAALAGTAFAQNTGPSTTTSPYVFFFIFVLSTTEIFTVGDMVNGYRMGGIPDGLGAFSNGNGSFDLVMNHELGATAGIARAHGSTGAFVSRWTIQNDLTVVAGRDHNQSASDIFTWNGTQYVAGTTAYSRLCSADLPAPSAFSFGTLGTTERIFMDGEEAGAEGRAFAHILTGSETNRSYQLPALGRFSWENSVASPASSAKTVVVGLDDSNQGQLYVYVGDKTDQGNAVERAGLTNGSLYGIAVNGMPSESRAAAVGAGTRFSLYNHGDVTNTTGAALETSSNANGVTQWLRPEDGAFDPRPGFENDFYFVTTDRFNSATQDGRARLYRMRFDDVTNPLAGGTVEALLDGTEGGNMFDNLTIDSHGRILIQEDIGGQDPLGKIWLYDIDTAGFVEVAAHAPEFFGVPAGPNFLTRDEESSGIIDARDILGDGWFLLDVQAHYNIPGELVQGGQLLAMYVAPSIVPAPGALALLGMGGLLAARRRR